MFGTRVQIGLQDKTSIIKKDKYSYMFPTHRSLYEVNGFAQHQQEMDLSPPRIQGCVLCTSTKLTILWLREQILTKVEDCHAENCLEWT